MTKQAIRALKSLYRDNDEREIYKHEIAAMSELVKGGYVRRDRNNCIGLTKKGKTFASMFYRADLRSK